MAKRFFWLKLKEDFFDEKYIKALRRLPQGDSLTVVYLKMQLKSLKTEGFLRYEGLLPNGIAELAMVLDEDESVVELAVNALIKFGVVERWDDETLYMKAMQQMIGSECDSAHRVRNYRALQCNSHVTKRNTEIDIDIEKELDIELELGAGAPQQTTIPKKKSPGKFQKPTVDEIKAYCRERKNGIDPEQFWDYYESKGWLVGKTAMKDWRAAVRTWEKRGAENGQTVKHPDGDKKTLPDNGNYGIYL